MKALKKVQTDLQPKCRPSTQYAACKLASSHLVRFALQIRRKAVGSLLGIKKNIMELELYNESDFGQRQHTESREPYFADAAYVTGSGKRAHLAQVINFQFIALSERHFVLSNAL